MTEIVISGSHDASVDVEAGTVTVTDGEVQLTFDRDEMLTLIAVFADTVAGREPAKLGP